MKICASLLLGFSMATILFTELYFSPLTLTVSFPTPANVRYVTIRWDDGRRLGNLLFNYAALRGIGAKNNLVPLLGDHFPPKSWFNLTAKFVSKRALPDSKFVKYEEHGRRACAYDDRVENLPWKTTKLYGFFQSWRYFSNIEKELREELTFDPNTRNTALTFIREHVPSEVKNNYTLVGIHVRRGDILLDSFRNYGYTTAPPSYFHNAMSYFVKKFSNVLFVIASDDIQWCKENIDSKKFHVIYSEGHADYIDLAILAQCNHFIVSVGSFGWWAAWLANGITIYYDKWPKEYSQLEYHVDKNHYFPHHWLPMS